MSTDTSPVPRRKRSITRYLAIALLLIAGLFAYQLLGPTPAIRVSPQTTYITAPLGPDGLPDYVAYQRDKLRTGVTHENNAAVLLWQAFGPGEGNDEILPENWQHITQELRLPPATNAYLVEPDSDRVTKAVEAWLTANDPAWKDAVENAPAIVDCDPLPEDLGYDVVFDAMDAPWRCEQLPPLAVWVDANSEALNLLVAGSRRPRFYSPFSFPDDESNGSLLESMSFDSITRSRAIARALTLRAMLHLGEGRHAVAWQDLLAVHRWARLVGQGPTIIEQLVAIAIDGIAASGTRALLGEQLPPEFARQVHAELLTLGDPSNMARSFDEGERLYFLDAVLAGRKKGIGTLLAENSLLFGGAPEAVQPLDYISANWNVTLTKGNQIYDQLAAACRLPTPAARRAALSRVEADLQQLEQQTRSIHNFAMGAISPAKRSDMLAAAVISTLSPIFGATSDAEDRASATLELIQLAAALAVYRAEHDEYPERLEQLVPSVIAQLPVDLYRAKPFVYHREADGYLLYSAGPNGIDDGGSHIQYRGGILKGHELPMNDDPATEKLRQQIPAGADDPSIRVPTPKFQLPAPPPPPKP